MMCNPSFSIIAQLNQVIWLLKKKDYQQASELQDRIRHSIGTILESKPDHLQPFLPEINRLLEEITQESKRIDVKLKKETYKNNKQKKNIKEFFR